MTLGEKIYALRKQQNMSQEQLSAIMGVSRQAISKWEIGESTPDVDNVVHLSEIFKVTTDYLLKNDEYVEYTPLTRTHKIEETASIIPARRSSYAFARPVFIAGGIGLIMSSLGGLLWPTTADMLFAASLYVICLGLGALVRPYLHKMPVPALAILGAKIILGSFIIVSIGGIQGFLSRDRADMILILAWIFAVTGNGLIFYSCASQFFNKYKKPKPEVIDLRPGAIERDAIEWKN